MTLTFDEFKTRVASRKIYLAEVWTGLHLQDFDKTSGYSYVYELPVVNVPMLNHLPIIEQVLENGAAYTQKASIALVDANAGSYFFDMTNKKIYVHTTGSDDPDGTTGGKFDYTLTAHFWLRFGSQGLIFNAKYYYPRISQNGLSDLKVSSRSIFFGIQTTGNGSLRLDNKDKFFDKLLKQYIWQYAPIYIFLGGDEMAYSDYKIVFKGTILDWGGGDSEITMTIKDHRSILTNDIPPNIFDQTTYPVLADGDNGKPIPLAYGYLQGVSCVKIGSTGKGDFKITNHAIHQIVKVYNNGSNITSYITKNLAAGEFTIGGGYSGTPGTVTADIFGRLLPATETLYFDDFEDNDISDWSQYSSGGSYSWTASGGQVNAVGPTGYSAFLIHPKKRFSSGSLEAKINASGYNGYGIVFEYTDYANFKAVYLYYSAAAWRVRIIHVASGSESEKTNDSVTLAPGTWYTLKITVSKDGLVTPYLNGVAKTAWDFGVQPTPLKTGLYIKSTATGSYNDFKIEQDFMWSGAQIVKDICTEWLGIDEDDIDTDSFDDATEKAPQILNLYLGSQSEAQSIIEEICHSNLCRFVIGENGKVHYSFWSSDDESIETIQPEEILGDYSAEEKESDVYNNCIVKYGQGAGTNVKIKTWGDERTNYLYQKGFSKEFKTHLTLDEDASALAYSLFQLLRTPITRYRLKAKMHGLDCKIGDVITVKRERGISVSGKHDQEFRIVGATKDFSRTEVTLEMVGNSAALGEALCEVACQQPCETACQATCELNCMETCQVYCEGDCQIYCKIGCEVNCTSTCKDKPACELTCQSGCTDACQAGICQDTCELACQTACMLGCLVGCQSTCTDLCQRFCQGTCEILTQ